MDKEVRLAIVRGVAKTQTTEQLKRILFHFRQLFVSIAIKKKKRLLKVIKILSFTALPNSPWTFSRESHFFQPPSQQVGNVRENSRIKSLCM